MPARTPARTGYEPGTVVGSCFWATASSTPMGAPGPTPTMSSLRRQRFASPALQMAFGPPRWPRTASSLRSFGVWGACGGSAGHSRGTRSAGVPSHPGSRLGFLTHSEQGKASVGSSPKEESATVSWTPGGDNGQLILDYTVTATPGGASCTTSESSCVLTGLIGGTGYTFTVTARDVAGQSDASDPSSVITPPVTTPPGSGGNDTPPTTPPPLLRLLAPRRRSRRVGLT